MNVKTISSSYTDDICKFILQEIKTSYYSVEEKEQLIQSGEFHYSEMLNKESAPSTSYENIFFDYTSKYKLKLAKDIIRLASIINNKCGDITLVSLARAGTPIGILLKKALEQYFQRESSHYTISIIRDRGIDFVALDYLLNDENVDPSSLVFVDGRTAKGVITKELKTSISIYNEINHVNLPADLYVVSDFGGVADYCATDQDYPIPSSMLNSTVSGLISRTVWQDPDKGKFHGAVFYKEFLNIDRSNWFINQIVEQFDYVVLDDEELSSRSRRNKNMNDFLFDITKTYAIDNINLIKPGIAEATRVMLRRVPQVLIIKNTFSTDIKHLVALAKEANIPIEVNNNMPFQACAIIKPVAVK